MNPIEEIKDNIREIKTLKWLMLAGVVMTVLSFPSAWYIGLLGVLIFALSSISYLLMLRKLNSKMLRYKESIKMMVIEAVFFVLGLILLGLLFGSSMYRSGINYTLISITLGLTLFIPALATSLKMRKEMKLTMKSSDYIDLMIVAVFVMAIVLLAFHRPSIIGTGLLVWSMYKYYKQHEIEKQKIFDSLKNNSH